MQRVVHWSWRAIVGAMTLAGFLVVAGCTERGLTDVVAPMTGDGAHHASYAGSSPYGDYYEVDGEVVPAGSGHPWDAVISNQASHIEWPSGCSGQSCNVEFHAYMAGLWHTTKQSIHWTVAGQSGIAHRTNFAPWECTIRVGLACWLAERTDTHEVRVDGHCNWEASAFSDHAAWWGAWFDLEIWGKRIGQIGRVEKSSVAPNQSFSDCQPSGGGGGGGGELVCYEFYVVWTDDLGYHEVYLGTECFEVYAT